jgi:uncharacterized protein (TIGR02246 family)
VQASCFQQEYEGLSELALSLSRAWNRGDSTAFASHFTDDGDLVNIYGMRMRGQASIAGVYDMLFRGVFRSSRLEPVLRGSRRLCDNAMVVHAEVGVHVPLGSLAGDHHAVCSMVVQRQGSEWRVASLQNTLVSDGAERRLVA